MEFDLDTRPFEDISRDLAEIDDAIRVTREFMIQYPDEPTIELSLRSWEYKKQLLFEELIQSNDLSRQHAFDVAFDGGPVSDSKISLDCLGDMLSSFQEVIKYIVSNGVDDDVVTRKITRNDVKKISQLNILAISTGSFRVIVAPSLTHDKDYGYDKSPLLDALDKFNQLINCDDNTSEIKKMKSDIGAQSLEKYKDFISNLKKYKLNVKFSDEIKTERIHKKEITNESATKIYKAINEEAISEKEELIIGKLRAIDTLERRFTFLTSEDFKIKGKYDKQLDDTLSNPDFKEEISAVFTHRITSNDILNKHQEDWILIGFSYLNKSKNNGKNL